MLTTKGLFEICECEQMGRNTAQNALKHGEKEKFSFWHFCGEKSEKVTKLRSGYAAGLPGGCFAVSASSAILQSRASRTQWPNGPAMARATPTTAFALLQGLAPPLHPAEAQGASPQFFRKKFYKAFSWQCKAQIRHRGGVGPLRPR